MLTAVLAGGGLPAGVWAQLPFRPIGSPSAVDRYRRDAPASPPASPPVTPPGTFVETGFRERFFRGTEPVRQVQFQSPSGFAPVPSNLVPSNPVPTNLPGPALPPASDLQPVAPPQLGGGFATSANTNLVTNPSDYPAMAVGLGPCGGVGGVPPGYLAPTSYTGPVPTEVPAAAVMPPPVAVPPIVVAPPVATGAPAGSLVSFGQETYPLQLGQGLWGQPVAYVPGQGVRNWFRYLSP